MSAPADCHDAANLIANALVFLLRDLDGLLHTVKRAVDAKADDARLRLIEDRLHDALVSIRSLIGRTEMLADDLFVEEGADE